MPQVSKSGYIILVILFLTDIFEIFLNYLNLKQLKKIFLNPPEDLKNLYNREQLKNSTSYQTEKNRLTVISKLAEIAFFYSVFIFGILSVYMRLINNFTNNEVIRGIIFFITFILLSFIIHLPFTIYDTFVIEKRYNFNKMTVKTFLRDTVISGVISFVLLSFLIAAIINFIRFTGNVWWIYASIFTILFSLFLTYIYPAFIAPLFNKFKLLEDIELKDNIFKMSEKADFPLEQVFQMDASKRTSHSNAYFTGLGRKKRIVLFDTLLKNYTNNEIIAIIAHELGHFKLKHIKKMLFISFFMITTGFLFANLIIKQNFLYNAFQFPHSIYVGLFLCMVIFSPANFITQPFLSTLSRKHEFEADKFGVHLTKEKNIFTETLKKLYKDNLANPMPAKLYKIFYYSHPTLLERISKFKELKK